jgi:deazaflavin-dependent oxidoreductase (nitroreductase family)
MPTAKDSLKDRLARYRQITITVIGRKSGREISTPVWFVLEDDNTLWLLPVQGSDTQWYKNVLHDPKMEISARGKAEAFQATPITDPRVVQHVVEAFRAKYGPGDVKKYYSKLDVAVRIDVARTSTP